MAKICYDLDFEDEHASKINEVPGLYYFQDPICNAIVDSIEKYLKSDIKWEKVGKGLTSREVIQFGYKYDYKSGKVTEKTTEFPPEIKKLALQIKKLKIQDKDISECILNQCIINKYEPGQGIGAHTDHPDYGEEIFCFTIGSGACMTFSQQGEIYNLYTTHRSLYVMTGDSRWKWTHEMKKRKNDIINGVKVTRGERISITFRSVNK